MVTTHGTCWEEVNLLLTDGGGLASSLAGDQAGGLVHVGGQTVN